MSFMPIEIHGIKQLAKKILFEISAFVRNARYFVAKARYRMDSHAKPVFSHPREIGLIKIDPYN